MCGILSFNLNRRQLSTIWEQFPDRYGVDVLPAPDLGAPVPKMGVGELFGDTQFLLTARKHVAFVTTLVTWDRDHFVDRFAGRIATPEEILA